MPGTNRFRQLLQTYVVPQWRQALLLMALMLCGVALDVATPQLIRRFIDAALAGAPVSALLALAATGGLREALVVPLLYMIWLVGVLFQSIPQAIVWGGLVAVALLAAWRSLAQPPGCLLYTSDAAGRAI